MADSSGKTIKAVQRKLGGLTVDGVAGPLTWAAIASAVGVHGPDIVDAGNGTHTKTQDIFDERSEQNIESLLPPVRTMARAFLKELLDEGFNAKFISGTRTYEQQAELYAKYRMGGAVAAPPGRSNHNFGVAVDLGLFDDEGKYLEDSPLYSKAGAIGKGFGFTWGGDWSNGDEPHFEYRPSWAANFSESDMISEFKKRIALGRSILT